ncbi:YfcE family phosphodiesterase [Aquipuribacter nitratireducens]|uniref:Phosphoesterase n=1 Tax=Aquipuribacter nitratireducens TaxID=650104 RepID=A0ABW0GQT2_9MICO
MRLLLLADTHVPARARRLPDEVWDAVASADVVVHAGDWVDVGLLDEMAERARRLVAVHGNNDGPALRARLPEAARADLAGLRVAVVHETGAAAGRETRCDARFGAGSPDPADVLVFGHSHIPWDTVTPSGLRLLNPGSPTDRRRQPRCTYVTATVRDGVLDDVRLVALPLRGT